MASCIKRELVKLLGVSIGQWRSMVCVGHSEMWRIWWCRVRPGLLTSSSNLIESLELE